MRSTAETVGESECLRMVTSAQLTVMTSGGVVGLPSLVVVTEAVLFFVSGRGRHTASKRDWSSDVCSSDLVAPEARSVPGPPKCRAPPEIVQAGSAEIGRASCRERVERAVVAVTLKEMPGPLLWRVTV